MTAPASPDSTLAAFASSLHPAALPPAVAAHGRLVLLDAIASAIAGARTVERPAVARLAGDLAGPGQTTVIAGAPLAPIGAVFLNGFQVTAATICDVHRPTLCHVTPEVVPATLAAAEAVGAGGAAVLAALVAGLEVTVRVASALDDESYGARGWHNPGVAGPFGGAAAAGRLLGLDARAMAMALGHAGSQSAGTFAALGTSGVKFHQARAAVSGFLAASLAAAGFDAAADALTAPRGGLLAAYAAGGHPERLTAGLGETWRFPELSLRRWPGASSIQALVEAALLAAVRRGDVAPVRARVALPPRSFELSGSAGWGTQLSALQSARYVTAVVLRDRACWLPQFDADRLADPALGAFAREHVEVVADPGLPPSATELTVELGDGSRIVERVDLPAGSPERPLTPDEVEAKLRVACAGTALESRSAAIIEAVDHLDSLPSIDRLTSLLADRERDARP